MSFTAQADNAERYVDCASAALHRAGPKNCKAYHESLSCASKAIQVMDAEHLKNKEARRAISEIKLGQKATQAAMRLDGCK